MAAEDWFGPDFEITPGNPAGFMVYSQQLGMSGNESLAAWRELGGTSGNQNWQRMYGEIGDVLARQPDMAALDPTLIPSSADYGTWSAGTGGKYATQVSVIMNDLDTGLQSIKQFTYFSDVAHTPQEAIDAGIAEYSNPDLADRYRLAAVGGFMTSIVQTVPYDQAA